MARVYGPVGARLKKGTINAASGDKSATMDLTLSTALDDQEIANLVQFAESGEAFHLVAVERDAGIQPDLFAEQDIDHDHVIELTDITGALVVVPAAYLKAVFQKFQAREISVELVAAKEAEVPEDSHGEDDGLAENEETPENEEAVA